MGSGGRERQGDCEIHALGRTCGGHFVVLHGPQTTSAYARWGVGGKSSVIHAGDKLCRPLVIIVTDGLV